MQKTKLFVTASAVCFALACAALSEQKSESSAILYVAGLTDATGCVQSASAPQGNCSILNSGAQCTVFVQDGWGNWVNAPAYVSPLLNNLCLLPLRSIGSGQ
jgi:hypothetical protein